MGDNLISGGSVRHLATASGPINAQKPGAQPAVTREARLDAQAHVAERTGGILASHLTGLQAVAEDKQVCVFIRAVNPESTDLIRDGFGTKDMAIKGKSSTIPPISALIPLDQVYGKKGADKNDADKFTHYNEASIQKGTATAVPLSLSVDRLKSLSGLTIQGGWLSAPPEAELSARSGLMTGTDGKRSFDFWGEKQGDGSVRIFHVVEDGDKLVKGEPFQVMGNREGKPVTADYDLALIAPRASDYGAEHTRPVKMTSFAELEARTGAKDDTVKDANGKTERDLAAAGFYKNIDVQEAKTQRFYEGESGPKKDFGNLSSFTRELIPELNRACKATGGREVFHHSDDAGNAFSVEGDNYPMTVILPDSALPREGADNIRIVKDHDELKTLFKELKNTGFTPIGNYAWGEDLMQVRSDSFEHARGRLDDVLKGGPASAGRNKPQVGDLVARIENRAPEPPRASGGEGPKGGVASKVKLHEAGPPEVTAPPPQGRKPGGNVAAAFLQATARSDPPPRQPVEMPQGPGIAERTRMLQQLRDAVWSETSSKV